MSLFEILKNGELYKLRKYRIIKGFLSEYKKYFPNWIKVFSIHRKGFSVLDWETIGLNNESYKRYLSTKMYNKIHPINGYYSKIIDDKLNIKYVFAGTEMETNIPKYYYLIDENGICHYMMDMVKKKDICEIKEIIEFLRNEKKLALKLVTGAIGKGFYKLEYIKEKFYLNNEEIQETKLCEFIQVCHNYVIMEYLVPHSDIAEVWPETTNTIRYLVGRVNNEWRLIKSFIRFGTKQTDVVEAFNAGGILCYVDTYGFFDGGYVIGKNKEKNEVVEIERHPNSGTLLKGKIPCWKEIIRVAEAIEKMFPQMKYLGLDFVVTDQEEVKLLEINSLTSLDAIQLDTSILETENGKWFFSSLI